MLLALAVLIIGGTVLFTGPVQAVVNFTRTGIRTTTDTLLCPDTIYTFRCEITGDELRLTSFDSDGVVFNGLTVIPGIADAGFTSNQADFNFTAFRSVNGLLAATAVMNSSQNLSSIELECRDVNDTSFTTLSTVVKDPLDIPDPDSTYPTCVVYDDYGTFIEVAWGEVDCAQSYDLNISGIDTITTIETSHQDLYSMFTTNISGSVSVGEGSLLPYTYVFFEECIVVFNSTSATLPETLPTIPAKTTSFVVIPVYNSRCCGKTETGYNISFIDFPAGGTAFYETSDGSVVNIEITDGYAIIFFESNVTVYVTDADGTVCYSEELEAPSISGRPFCCVWLILVIVLVFVIVCGVCGAIAIKIIAKKCCGEPKVANQGNIDLAHDESEMKTVPL